MRPTWQARLTPALLIAFAVPLSAQARDEGTLTIAVPVEPGSPVPTLWNNDQANRELSDLLFLHLADLGPQLSTTDESSFVPRLARRWTRRDPLTLVFDLDPRARWHDGAPVTAADVVLALDRARDARLSPQLATLLRRVKAVTARGERQVEVRFTEPYAEQLYDAVQHAPPLPAHLLAGLPPESLATAPFLAEPVGSGPYRLTRRSPGQFVELTAVPGFFLGAAGIPRVRLLIAQDAETRANLLLSGAADAYDNIYNLADPARFERLPGSRLHSYPGLVILYAGFNQRDPSDTARPHPLFTDPALRRALLLALDRPVLGRAAYGPDTRTPSAPVSAVLERVTGAPPGPAPDPAAARDLLAARGWADHDGDGILDREGRPLAFRILVPSVAVARMRMATAVQEAWRRLGIRAELDPAERAVFLERRRAGRFDLDLSNIQQDPSPAGLVQSWTCAAAQGGGANVLRWCDPEFDSLLARAGRDQRQATRWYRQAMARMADAVPAIPLAATMPAALVHERFRDVVLRPESTWLLVWQWKQ